MVLFNYSTKELTAKVVYYGPGLCGKTTNLQWIHEKLPIKNKGKMLSLATETDRTLFFDFLPIELGTIRGMKTRIQLYTVPGQVFYNATRRMVLKGADCVVFVCDSQEAMLDPNLESLENLRQNLEANEIDPEEIPTVLQYNKRDLPNALPIEILNERLNPRGLPFFEAVAVKGIGVEETLKGVTGLVFKSLAAKYGGAEPAAARPAAPTPAPTPAAPTPAPVRPAPAPPRAAPEPPAPPAVMVAAPGDELLDSLELEPAPEMPEPAATGPAAAEEIEAFEAEPVEELSFDTAPSGPADAKATLVSGPRETEDLRRRISRPVLPEVSLREIEAEEAEIDELSLDETPAPEPFQPPPPPPPTPAPPPPPLRPVPAASPRPPLSPTATVPPVPPRPALSVSVEPTTTASVQLLGAHPEGGVPVEVTMKDGAVFVTVHLNLVLKLDLKA